MYLTDYLYVQLHERRLRIMCNYLDFSRAFDSLVHFTLLIKIKYYSINGLAFKLIESISKILNNI